MPSELEKTPTLSAWLEDQLMPPEQAAIAAYFHLSGSARHLHGDAFLAEVLPLVTAALAAVAPIYAAKDDADAPHAGPRRDRVNALQAFAQWNAPISCGPCGR